MKGVPTSIRFITLVIHKKTNKKNYKNRSVKKPKAMSVKMFHAASKMLFSDYKIYALYYMLFINYTIRDSLIFFHKENLI